MLMTPDSSLHPTPITTIKPIQSVIRVQVQECSQSQQHSSISSHLNGPSSQPQSNIYFISKMKSERCNDVIQVTPSNQYLPGPSVVSHQQQSNPAPSLPPPAPRRPETPEYTKSFPVMDTTVASSMKGEPDLNIGKLISRSDPNRLP